MERNVIDTITHKNIVNFDRQSSITDAAGTRNFAYNANQRLANETDQSIVNGVVALNSSDSRYLYKKSDALIMLSFNQYIIITRNGQIKFRSSQHEGQQAAANER